VPPEYSKAALPLFSTQRTVMLAEADAVMLTDQRMSMRSEASFFIVKEKSPETGYFWSRRSPA
jgi:hypothetical protein